MSDLKEVISARKAADLIGVTEEQLAEMRERGEGPKFHTVGHGRLRHAGYFLEDVVDFLIANAEPPSKEMLEKGRLANRSVTPHLHEQAGIPEDHMAIFLAIRIEAGVLVSNGSGGFVVPPSMKEVWDRQVATVLRHSK